jgi:hypothetical protein
MFINGYQKVFHCSEEKKRKKMSFVVISLLQSISKRKTFLSVTEEVSA